MYDKVTCSNNDNNIGMCAHYTVVLQYMETYKHDIVCNTNPLKIAVKNQSSIFESLWARMIEITEIWRY